MERLKESIVDSTERERNFLDDVALSSRHMTSLDVRYQLIVHLATPAKSASACCFCHILNNNITRFDSQICMRRLGFDFLHDFSASYTRVSS